MAGVKRSFNAMRGLDDTVGVAIAAIKPAMSAQVEAAESAESAEAVTRTPSPTFPPLVGDPPRFNPGSSIVFVGIRGAGKSTLAVIASSAMKLKVIDMEAAFQRATAFSSAGYKKLNGSLECQKQQAEVLRGVLDCSRTGCVIVCSWMERRVQRLLREFAATNPVIHILRDAAAIQDHLGIREKAKMNDLLRVSSAIFRTCTNFEFFNISEPPSHRIDSTLQRFAFAPYLALKKAERHLLKFLSLIYPVGTSPFLEPVSPLACIPLVERHFTYALSMPLPGILNGSFDIEENVTGVDAVEIVVEDLAEGTDSEDAGGFHCELASTIARGVGMARRRTVLPINLHIVLPEAPSEGATKSYKDLLAHGLRLVPEMITVDLRLDDSDLSPLLTSERRSKVIGHYSITMNPPPWDSPTWVSLYKRARWLGCDLVRLTRLANEAEDRDAVSRLRSAVASLNGSQIPLIAYNSGHQGRTSACFNSILTTVAPYSSTKRDSHYTGMPCLTASAATRALYASFIYDTMKLYVFGVNVGYSISPAMHNAALIACGIPHVYKPFSADSLSDLKHLIEDPYFGGASVGLPYKVEIISLTHSLSRHARAIGAVNTLIPVRQLNPDGSIPEGAALFNGMNKAGPVRALHGENTDWIGIRACIRRGLSPANAVKPGTCGIIVGAGGMARAAVYAMLQIGVKNIIIYNRTAANAEKMARDFTELLEKDDSDLSSGGETKFHIMNGRDDPWPPDFKLPTIIISCIPTHRIGNVPAPDFTVPEAWLKSQTGGVVIELGYKTLDTPLLRQARKEASRGWVALDGLDLLPDQGFAQFEFFTGRRAPRRLMTQDSLLAYMDEQGSSNQGELQLRLRSIAEQEG